MTQINDLNNSVSDNLIARLVSNLDDKDGLNRREVRIKLERIGAPAVPHLVRALQNPKAYVRWEATKALVKIADPQAAPDLVKLLMDEQFEIQWLAAEALIAIGEEAVVPLLEELTKSYGSVFLRQGAHHVLHDLRQKDLLDARVMRVIDELSSIEPVEPFPIIARRALEALRSKNHTGYSSSTKESHVSI